MARPAHTHKSMYKFHLIFFHCRYSENKKAFQCEICCSLYVQKLVGRFAAVPEKFSEGPVQIPAVPKKNFECECDSTLTFQNGLSSAVPEKKDSVAKTKDSVFEKKNLTKKHACEKCGSIFFIKKLDGNSECKTCAFQNGHFSASPEKKDSDQHRLERFLTVFDKCLTVFALHRQT